MDRPELLSQLPRLRRAQVGNLRVPHKPLLLLWLFGRFATTGTTLVSYQDAGAASSSTPCWSSGNHRHQIHQESRRHLALIRP